MTASTATARKTLRRHYGNKVVRDLAGRPLCLVSAKLRDGEEFLLDAVRPGGRLRLFRFDSTPPREVGPDVVERVFVPAELRQTVASLNHRFSPTLD
ncbi:hypothetical protein CKO28_02860 [Rhodovibrio sodomensis]|uniref:Uncharacterized protein n=1 Tax=Rhodovibrio sodomensis TaxID=1088 RepID=A0ABS1DBA2_9PROT|nr:hypothetical protein [Rhodovibrio sodomensis]MBK1666983.1 hypothetical protein [Rhodovibrio sodomensis]